MFAVDNERVARSFFFVLTSSMLNVVTGRSGGELLRSSGLSLRKLRTAMSSWTGCGLCETRIVYEKTRGFESSSART